MQRQRFWIISLGLGLWMLALLVPLPSEALIVSGTGRINFRDEGVAEGSSGTVNCQGAGIECEIVSGILNINVSGGGLDSGLEDPGGNGLVNRTGAGVTAPYAGTTCTNQVLRVLSAAGAGTCITVTSAYVDASVALTGGHLGQFAATTSAQLAGVLSDEDGVTGGFVRAGGTVALATALAANGANCTAGQFPLGVDASGAVESCTALPTTITGTANQITASASTGAIVLSIPTNPTLPGNTTGTFIGNLTGTASLATALAANGANCSAGSAPLGVDAAGAVESCFAVQPAVTWGNGLSIAGATANVASTETNFLTDGATTDLVCGAAAQGKMQVMDAGTLQYCGGETTALLWKGFLTQSGLSWNVTAATCTGDTNGGKLTVNESAQIVCASDTGGGGGGGANTFAAADFNLTGDDVSLDYVNATMATGSNNGFLSSTDFMLFSAKQEAVSWGAGLAFDAGVATVASQESGFFADGGITDLTCGGGALGQVQVMNSGALQYCDGADDAVLRHGYLLPSPLTWNITAATCTGDTNSGKLTVNGSNQVVCASDVAGEGGESTGDLTAFGTCATGDCATTGSPLVNFWLIESAAPAAPASTQGLVWLDETSKNLSIKTADGVIKRMVQSVEAVPNQVITALAPDGAFSQAQLSTANLSDGSTLVKLTEPQILEAKQIVTRATTLSAASGTVTAPNADLYEMFERHDVSGTLTIPNPTASGLNPRVQQPITFSLYAASAQTVVWDTAYATGYGVPLPTTLPAGQYVAVGMRWNTLSGKWETWGNTADTMASVPDGGTGVATLTGVAIGNGTSAFTAATSSTVGEVLRVTGANTYAFGALDLADTDAVTGVLANARTTATNANTASAIVARDGSGNFTAGTITAALTGNATTATALAANPTACSAGQFASDIAADGTLTCGTPAGGGTGTVHLPVGGYKLPATDPAQLDTSATWNRLLFDNTTRECAIWQGNMNADYVAGLTLKADFNTSATSGSFHLDVRLRAITDGDAASIEAKAWGTSNDCNDAAVRGTALQEDRITCTLTNADSLAANDLFQIEICRDVANDDAAAKVGIIHGKLEYTK